MAADGLTKRLTKGKQQLFIKALGMTDVAGNLKPAQAPYEQQESVDDEENDDDEQR